MKVLIGTKNPGKIEGATKAFKRYFEDAEVIGIPVSSDVNDQPFDEEVLTGARNRVKNVKNYAKENNIEADFYVAIEGGITTSLGTIIELNIAVVEDKDGFQSVGTSQGFPIPEKYMDDIKTTDFGTVMDKILNGNGLSKGKGGIGILTHDQVSRIDITENAFIMALTSHTNGNIWR